MDGREGSVIASSIIFFLSSLLLLLLLRKQDNNRFRVTLLSNTASVQKDSNCTSLRSAPRIWHVFTAPLLVVASTDASRRESWLKPTRVSVLALVRLIEYWPSGSPRNSKDPVENPATRFRMAEANETENRGRVATRFGTVFPGHLVVLAFRGSRLAEDTRAAGRALHLNCTMVSLSSRLLRLVLRVQRGGADVADETGTRVVRPVPALQREMPVGHVRLRVGRKRLVPLLGRPLLLHLHVTQHGD